jgi:hypothetical protein
MPTRQERIAKLKQTWTDVSWDDMSNYIGPNAESYRKVWEKNRTSFIEKGKPPFNFNWSWPAFFPILGIPWALARKQWLFAGLMVGAIILLNILGAYMPSTSFGFMPFLVAIMAKPFYVQQAVANIAKIKSQTQSAIIQQDAIRNAGGLNMTYGYVAAVISVAVLAAAIAGMVYGEY